MANLTDALHRVMLRSQGYRAGDLTHEALGDVEIECPDCHGNGRVDLHNDGRPHGNEKWATCERCHGFGTVWIERREVSGEST